MTRLVLTVLVWCALAASAVAQPNVYARELFLGSTPCRVLTGSGTPEGNVEASCGLYVDTSTGAVWQKTGPGDTGWELVTFTLLDVARGGTGASSFTANGVLYGAGSSALQATAAGGSNTVLAANGGAPFFTSSPSVASLSASTSVTTPRLVSSGDLTLDPAGGDVLPATPYAVNVGAVSAKFLTGHFAELWSSTLVAQQRIATIGGRVIVAPTTQLAADLSASATSISVKHDILSSGAVVVLEGSGQVEWMGVTSGASGSGPYSYNVTRNLDGSGANAWTAGDAVVNTGTSGSGHIDLTATAGVLPGSTVGPTIAFNQRTGSTYSQIEPRCAIGQLNGYYGYASSTFGLACGSPTGPWVKVDPVNGVRLGHNTTTRVQVDASGNASFTGAVTASTLTATTAGNIAGWSIASSSLTATNVGLYSGAANTARVQVGTGSNAGGLNSCNASTDIGLWIGNTHANRASAPFRVQCGGTTRIGNVLVDTSTGNMGIGDAPTTAARLNIASPDDTVNTYGVIVSNSSGTQINFVAYGNGRTYINGPIYMGSVAYDTTGASSNATMILNGPFGSGVQMSGWIQVYVNGVQRWIPVW